MDVEEIFSLKYNELQKRAKSLGIRANMKIDKLRNALIEHVLDQNKITEKQQDANDKKTSESQGDEEKPNEVENKGKKGPGRRKKEKVMKSKAVPVIKDTKPTAPASVKTVRPGLLGSKQPSVLSPLVRKSLATTKPCITPKGTPRPFNTPTRTPKALTPQINKVKSATTKVVTPKNVAPRIATPKVLTPKPKLTTPKLSTPKSALKSATPNKPKTQASVKRMSNQKRTPQEAKKRRSTFEIVPLPDEPTENQCCTRRSTFEKKSVEERKSGSPGAQEMLGALTENMGSAEMKEKLLSAIDKKVQKKVSEKDPVKKTGIPRFAAFLAARKEAKEQKPLTPGNKNWTKIHKKEFDKMESIDVYLSKKRRRQDDFASSAKKTKTLLEETKAAISKLKSHKTPTAFKTTTKSSLFVTPGTKAVKTKTPVGVSKTKTPVGVSKTKTPVAAVLKTKTPVTFKPTVFSTKNMNLDFNTNTRKSPRASSSGTATFQPSVLSTSNMNLNFSKLKTPGTLPKGNVTPFRFDASINCTLNDSKSTTKKFDLKASLARPITWKTHKGTLKPLETATMYSTAKGEPKVSVKTPKVAGRENRRAVAMKKRADQKFDKHMSRRGIKAQ
ncbi:nucleolar and spindle-associated protein 1-like isoform X2 [Mizuhopecten yessoensis]|uniref:nucleolar and spindle-associated protein 1-like isoform X2 n=1 Tax=Mizuhopecten yessoensis TaxID=6573 RepID=UPI000B457F88|nr:nucleolar and spindle-associated protein 1-like isoform X2 [Mizuhopecten yessoensis]